MVVKMNMEINFFFLINLTYDCIELLATLFIEIIGLRPICLTQCCTQFKLFGNKTFCFRTFISFQCECLIIMQIQYTKTLDPGKFELDKTLS